MELIPKFLLPGILDIISKYDGGVPLSEYLKQYFKNHRNAGSRDRRMTADAVFAWYRCSRGFGFESRAPTVELIEQCFGLVASPGPAPEGFNLQRLMPQQVELSVGISCEEWLGSMLRQPDLFLRIRGNMLPVLAELEQAGWMPRVLFGNCIVLPAKTDVARLLAPDTYVVQDASSQWAASGFQPKPRALWLDCCCGAGGKSLFLKDLEPSVGLVVTDRRKSIIHNLKERFGVYRLHVPTSHVVDASDKDALDRALGSQLFDGIICDVPCSGSGTWARTPEQLHFFGPDVLQAFHALQTSIAVNVSRFLKPGGTLHYITCSVFKAENEDCVAEIAEKTGLQITCSEAINGLDRRSDSMFSATFVR